MEAIGARVDELEKSSEVLAAEQSPQNAMVIKDAVASMKMKWDQLQFDAKDKKVVLEDTKLFFEFAAKHKDQVTWNRTMEGALILKGGLRMCVYIYLSSFFVPSPPFFCPFSFLYFDDIHIYVSYVWGA